MRALMFAAMLASAAAQGGDPALDPARAFVRGAADGEQYLGAVMLVARAGQVLAWDAYGYRDLARREAMPRDAIFRIYSMTKAVTAVAVLQLQEAGKLRLDDRAAHYLPALAAHAGQVTIRQLLSHTSGFGAFDEGDTAPDLEQYVARLATRPLAHAPGSTFHYDGVPVQVAARVVEVVSGQRFDRYVDEHVLRPLRMVDTGFEVPPAKRSRVADMTTTSADGALVAPAPGLVPPPGERLRPFFSGAGGLYSTAPDYARFAQMLANGGVLDGARILQQASVQEMMRNQLTHLNPPTNGFSEHEGFGLGGYVVLDGEQRGRYGWSGAGGTYFTIDPRSRLVAVLMTQHVAQGLPRDPPKLAAKFYRLVYQSLGN